jgi:hypothetical protein
MQMFKSIVGSLQKQRKLLCVVLSNISIINSIFERKARLLNIDITKALEVKFLGTNSDWREMSCKKAVK